MNKKYCLIMVFMVFVSCSSTHLKGITANSNVYDWAIRGIEVSVKSPPVI